MKQKILAMLSCGPMTPKSIVAKLHKESSFVEITTALFGLMQDGLIDTTPKKEFYIKDYIKDKAEEEE